VPSPPWRLRDTQRPPHKKGNALSFSTATKCEIAAAHNICSALPNMLE
jgi:hypothetical protein